MLPPDSYSTESAPPVAKSRYPLPGNAPPRNIGVSGNRYLGRRCRHLRRFGESNAMPRVHLTLPQSEDAH